MHELTDIFIIPGGKNKTFPYLPTHRSKRENKEYLNLGHVLITNMIHMAIWPG
jgi:hypothetical protein